MMINSSDKLTWLQCRPQSFKTLSLLFIPMVLMIIDNDVETTTGLSDQLIKKGRIGSIACENLGT